MKLFDYLTNKKLLFGAGKMVPKNRNISMGFYNCSIVDIENNWVLKIFLKIIQPFEENFDETLWNCI